MYVYVYVYIYVYILYTYINGDLYMDLPHHHFMNGNKLWYQELIKKAKFIYQSSNRRKKKLIKTKRCTI